MAIIIRFRRHPHWLALLLGMLLLGLASCASAPASDPQRSPLAGYERVAKKFIKLYPTDPKTPGFKKNLGID